MGAIKDASGSYAWGMVTIACCALVAAVIVVALGEAAPVGPMRAEAR